MQQGLKNTSYFENKTKARLLSIDSKGDSMPYRYCFVLTNACNLRCSFCFQEKKPIKGSLKLDNWIDVASQLPYGSHITLTGGEPLMFRGFKKLVENLRDDITFNVITNGLLLEKDLVDFLLDQNGLKVLSCSIDDVGNKSRDFTADMWEKLISNLNYFKVKKNQINKNIVLDIKTVVHGGNIDGIIPMAKFCSHELGSDTHMFMFLKGSPMQHSDIMFEYGYALENNKGFENYEIPKVINEVKRLKDLIKSGATKNTKFFLHPKFVDLYTNQDIDIIEKFLDKPHHNPKDFMPCRSPWVSIHINNDGHVFPCLSFSIGNIYENTLKEIVNSQKMNQFKEDLEKCGTLPGCKQCGYLMPKETSLV